MGDQFLHVKYSESAVSGTLVEISHDGNGFGGKPGGSIVLCRGPAEIGHAKGTCLLAHEGAQIAHAHGVTFFGSEPTTSHRNGACKVMKVPPSFSVEPRSAHPLEKKFAVLGSMRPKGLVFRFEGKRYVATLGDEIVDEAGEKVPGLENCRLTFVGDEFAAISSGGVDIPLRLPKN